MSKRLKLGAGNEIVQSDAIALFMNTAAQREQVGIRFYRFENFDYGCLARQTKMDSVAQQALIEVQKCFLAAKRVLHPGGEQRVRNYLFRGGGSVSAVELIARLLGTI